ncbi:MAG: hypothetical protein HY329_13205 [Chloroflexi bacterium]|nr:hypothetical protein [Chloroflexota bacterium]
MSDSIAIDFDVPAPMCDGTVLYADVFRPAALGRFPVLLNRLPYGKNDPLRRVSSLAPDPTGHSD